MKKIVQKVTEKTRGRRRSATPYVGNIIARTGLNANNIYRACEDRKRWQGIVKKAASATNINDDNAEK